LKLFKNCINASKKEPGEKNKVKSSEKGGKKPQKEFSPEKKDSRKKTGIPKRSELEKAREKGGYCSCKTAGREKACAER
jgi:hypothetical protein